MKLIDGWQGKAVSRSADGFGNVKASKVAGIKPWAVFQSWYMHVQSWWMLAAEPQFVTHLVLHRSSL